MLGKTIPETIKYACHVSNVGACTYFAQYFYASEQYIYLSGYVIASMVACTGVNSVCNSLEIDLSNILAKHNSRAKR